MGEFFIEQKFFNNVGLHSVFIINIITLAVFFLFFFDVIDKKKHDVYLHFALLSKALFAVFLLYRFYPYDSAKITFTELDRQICFSSGIFILMITVTDYVAAYIDMIKRFTYQSLPV